MGVSLGKKAVIILLMVLVLAGRAGASDTMLMFVGEDLEVLTIASRKEEAAWSAPAVAEVVTREAFIDKGAFTIAQTLEDVTGFHISSTEKGSVTYLRGIPDSTLFLYDTVPLGSGAQKSNTHIDYETSLAPIKRIEIIRGAGSVLWGADAFAGVVNAVPMTGKDFQGVETGLLISSGETPGEAYVNFGKDTAAWDSFLSVSGRLAKDDDSFNVVRFWNDGITAEPVETRYGKGNLEDSHYINLYGSVTYNEWLVFSAKISDSQNAFSVADGDHTYSWQENMETFSSVFKLEASKSIDADSGVRFTGYISTSDLDHGIVDTRFDQSEQSIFGELIYDRSLFVSKALLTLGTSWREDTFEDILVWDSFYPSFFSDENVETGGLGPFLPTFHKNDYEDNLLSLFGQYRHEFESVEVWAGVRYDDHDLYEDKTSYNTGFAWHFSNYVLKGIYGTAYRTPLVGQIKGVALDPYLTYDGDKLEKIENLNLQLSGKFDKIRTALTVFRNEIDNHVTDNRYQGTGLSTPNSQTIDGIEFDCEFTFTDTFKMSGNVTLLNNTGPDETYFYNDYYLQDEDGNWVKHYVQRNYAYDVGADTLFNLNAAWQITPHITLIPELRYFSGTKLYDPIEDFTKTCDPAWVANVNLQVQNLFPFDLGLYFNNIFDTNYETPGMYSVIQDQSFNAGLFIRMKW